MFETGLENILNKGSLKEVNSSNFKFIDRNLIVPNPFNQNRQNDINIDKIKNSILESGLINPLVVIEKDDKYMLISGHGRFEALKQIDEYNFQGNVKNSEVIPVLIDKTLRSDIENKLNVLKANAQKEESTNEKLENVRKAQWIYNQLRLENKITKEDNIKKRTWISNTLGYSESTVQQYLSKINKENEDIEDLEEVIINSNAEKEKIIKKIISLERYIIQKQTLLLEEQKKEIIDNLENLLLQI